MPLSSAHIVLTMMDSRLLLFFIVGTGFSQSTRCPRKWIGHGDNCYLFLGEINATKSTAESICKGNGGYMVSMETDEEQTFVYNHIEKHEDSLKWWISARRWSLCGSSGGSNQERLWAWDTPNGKAGFTAKNFMDTDYDQKQTDRSNKKRCLTAQQYTATNRITLKENFSWVPTPCDHEATVMCMKPACPKTWTSVLSTKCMVVVENETTYDQQVSNCRDKHAGQLLQIDSYPEFREVTRNIYLKYKDTNHTYGIEGGIYLGFMATEFTKPVIYNRYNRNRQHTRAETTYNCNSVSTCERKAVDFAPWLTDEPDFYEEAIGVNSENLWRPRFSICPSYNSTWKKMKNQIYGLTDNERTQETWFICEKRT